VVTAACVALGLPWWVNGLISLAIIVAVLAVTWQRSRQTRFAISKTGAELLPPSVRLVKSIEPELGLVNGGEAAVAGVERQQALLQDGRVQA
jgi:NADH-quinone oxidoreductase subunit H